MEAVQSTPDAGVHDTVLRDTVVRDAVRDGLREVGSPISRRLAEVKGLHNNSIRRLERIEATLDSERNARIDDLALLVELLTEGWRSLNVRLARIEQQLAASPRQQAEDVYQRDVHQRDVYQLPRAEAS